MEDGDGVVIIGAGVAGLAAATALARKQCQVALLEARSRIGGRVATIHPAGRPIELGAEFIHGDRNVVWEQVRAASLPACEVPDRHWAFRGGVLRHVPDFWDKIAEVTRLLPGSGADVDFARFLESRPELSPDAKMLATNYVEGFHAADPRRIGVQALRRADEAAEQDHGTRQFRVAGGYGALARWLTAQAQSAGVAVRLRTVAKRIAWRAGEVVVDAAAPDGPVTFRARRAIITLPVGVLQAGAEHGLVFEPEVPQKQQALRRLAAGAVVKVMLQFDSAPLPPDRVGFVQAPELPVPVWWPDETGQVLTGWTGGPKANADPPMLSSGGLLKRSLESLATIADLPAAVLRSRLVDFYHHDWLRDTFSLGAYSYTLAGGIDAPKELAEPVSGTLFFAGEATAHDGRQGTVHGALASGLRAAEEVSAAARRG